MLSVCVRMELFCDTAVNEKLNIESGIASAGIVNVKSTCVGESVRTRTLES